jgi:hypothetical protein
MARLSLDLLKDLQSRCISGKSYILRIQGEDIFIRKFPDMSNVEWTPKQKKQRSLFAEAQAYAREFLSDVARTAQYKETLGPGKRAYNQLIADYMIRAKQTAVVNSFKDSQSRP